MSDPLVSVIIITYNHEKYLRDSIEGCLEQKTDFPYEIIIHDDASTDGTTDIVREYAEKYPDLIIPILQKENQYSKGTKIIQSIIIPHSKGEYIAICEGDDYWCNPNKLERQIKFLQENPSFVGSSHQSLVISGNNLTLFRKKVKKIILISQHHD